MTSLRFFAAAFVVLFHAWYPFTGLQGVSGAGSVQFGYTSVGFFFVLSGFVLAWTWQPGVGIPTLWWRRIARIFPLCALLTVAVALYYLWVPGTAPVGEPPAWGSFFTSFFLLQSWPQFRYLDAYNFPSWSLSTEFFFYALFPFLVLLLVRLRRRMVLRGAVFFLVAYVVVALVLYRQNYYSYTAGSLLAFPPLQFLKFGLGACLGVAVKRGWRPRFSLWVALPLLVGIYAIMPRLTTMAGPASALRGSVLFPDIVLVLPMALLVVAAACSDLRGGTFLGRCRPLVRLGDWSYALYLVQAPVLFASYQIRVRSGHLGPPGWWWMVVFFAVCIGTSGLLYHLFERPLERWLRSSLFAPALQLAAVARSPARPSVRSGMEP